MPAVIVNLAAIVLLTAVISLAILYHQYRSWPPYAWKQRLVGRLADLRTRHRELGRADPEDLETLADRQAAECFRRHLRTIDIDRLAEYPGIGPGTIERVRSARCRTVDDLTSFPFESIHGIGPGKAHELRTAVAGVVREARARFDAGGCPEAEEYRRERTWLAAEAKDRSAGRQRELSAVEAALGSADDLLGAAREVTFWNYLFRRGTAGPGDEIMNRPLPTAKVPPPPIPAVTPNARPLPPPAPVGREAFARPGPQQAAFAPTSPPKPASSPSDLFQAELHGRPGSATPPGDHPGLPKLVAYARFAFVVAKADGRVAQAEKKVIRAFLDERFGHDPALVRQIDPLMERTEARVPSTDEAVAGLLSVTAGDERIELYRFAERIADASGGRNQRERDLLGRVALALGVAPEIPAPAPTPGTAPAADPRAVLEIDAGTAVTPDVVRRRFALLTDRLDPAKAAALGADFARMAEEKRTRLRAAAEALLAPFGEPLDKPETPPPADLRHNPDLDDVFGN